MFWQLGRLSSSHLLMWSLQSILCIDTMHRPCWWYPWWCCRWSSPIWREVLLTVSLSAELRWCRLLEKLFKARETVSVWDQSRRTVTGTPGRNSLRNIAIMMANSNAVGLASLTLLITSSRCIMRVQAVRCGDHDHTCAFPTGSVIVLSIPRSQARPRRGPDCPPRAGC